MASRALRPFDRSNRFNRSGPPVEYSPKHPRLRKMKEACTRGSLSRVQRLVEEWLAMPTPDLPPGPIGYEIGALEPVFHHAIRKSKGAIVSYLMDEGILMSVPALDDALEYKASVEVFQAFLDHGWNINEPLDEKAPPPLAYVLESEELLIWFLDHGANPNVSCAIGETPFMRAASHAPLSVVKLMYERGALPGNTAPCAAESITPGRPEVLKFLLDIGAPINAFDHVMGKLRNLTALMNACCRDTEDTDMMVEILLSRGAMVDIADQKGETAIDLAKKCGGPRKIELLFAHLEQRQLKVDVLKAEPIKLEGPESRW